MGGTNLRAGLLDQGELIKVNRESLAHKESEQKTIQQLIGLIEPLVVPELKGIGIGVPSVVDVEKGIVYDVVNIPSWKKVELKKILETNFGVPVFINNDVNCFALGEYSFGKAAQFDSLVALTLGTGLGAGIVLKGQVYEGSNCGAGEIGYLPYLDSNYELYTSGSFFERCYKSSGKDLFEQALRGERAAIEAWIKYGQHLGGVIKAVMYAYDPKAIVLGGSISNAYDYFEASMKLSLHDFQYPESVKRILIFKSELENASLLGAAALVRFDS